MSTNNMRPSCRLRLRGRPLVGATVLAILAWGPAAAEGTDKPTLDCFGKRATIVGTGDDHRHAGRRRDRRLGH